MSTSARRSPAHPCSCTSAAQGTERFRPGQCIPLNLQRNAALLAEHEIRFIPGLNEELGATVVFGGQPAGEFPKPKYDGVLGMWYGKAPGVDRTGDLFRHANFAGVGPHGGVLAVAGDDPVAKSSTFPTASELAF